MAIITEEPEHKEPPNPSNSTHKPTSSSSNPTHKPTSSSTPNPFTFWAYFTLSVSLVTLLSLALPSLTPPDPKTWFLTLPSHLRLHYSTGRPIKVQTNPNHSPIEVFTIQHGPKLSEHILIVHGLGCSSYPFRQIVKDLGFKGLHAVAMDLPGSGFSDKATIETGLQLGGVLGRFWDVYSDIKENGLFWAFDHIVETGHIPYEEIETRASSRKSVKVLELGPEEVGRVLGQVVDSMGLGPVHLVLHDSALGMVANWVSENLGSVRSVTLIDTAPRAVALPLRVLEMPVVGEVVLGFSVVFARFLRLCCLKSVGGSDVEAHRVLLKGRDGRRAVVGMGKKLNYSFDLAEWGGSEGVKGMPIQVIWSSNWSEEWSEEGRRVANVLPQATFVTHSGGRWPQEDTANELAENIVSFVSSLPKSVRQVEEEPLHEHIQKMFDEAKGGDHHHHHDHGGHDHHDGHSHVYPAGYGLGHGWES